MLRIIGAPSRYIQGPGAWESLPAALAEVAAGPAFLILDPEVERRHGARLRALLPEARTAVFAGEITASEIARLTEEAGRPAIVVGAGGGKTLDAAKGVSLSLSVPVAILPTAASNDAPTSRLIVVYDQAHRIAEVRRLRRNPELVLVDTSVVAQAPRRLLAAGIGDALSKLYEAGACHAAGGENFFGGRAPLTALALARTCHEVILRDGVAALAAVDRGTPDAALEDVVEACILLSGLGFEAGGLSLAHSLTRGFSAHAETGGALHGELVAFGTVVQILAEGHPAEEAERIIAFCDGCGLPTTLAGLGLKAATDADLRAIAGPSLTAPYIRHLPVPLDEARLVALLREADALGSRPRPS
jgi:glycerol dehydrogenase